MKFESVEQITKEFDLEFISIANLKRELKTKLAKFHPDRNGGSFKSNGDKEIYESLISAYDFVSSQKTDIVSRDEISALTKAIKDLAVEKNKTKTEEVLAERIDNSIKSYSSIHLLPKISTTAIASVISILWLFPETVSEHQILSSLIEPSSNGFTFLWLGTMFFSGIIWIILKLLEMKNASMKKTFNLESTQNMLFNEFVRYQLYDDDIIERGYMKFRKEDLIEFIRGFNLGKRKYDYKRGYRLSPLSLFLDNRNINLELHQCLADLIINKAVLKGLVTVDKSKSLSDEYTLKVNEESKNYYRHYIGI